MKHAALFFLVVLGAASPAQAMGRARAVLEKNAGTHAGEAVMIGYNTATEGEACRLTISVPAGQPSTVRLQADGYDYSFNGSKLRPRHRDGQKILEYLSPLTYPSCHLFPDCGGPYRNEKILLGLSPAERVTSVRIEVGSTFAECRF